MCDCDCSTPTKQLRILIHTPQELELEEDEEDEEEGFMEDEVRGEGSDKIRSDLTSVQAHSQLQLQLLLQTVALAVGDLYVAGIDEHGTTIFCSLYT